MQVVTRITMAVHERALSEANDVNPQLLLSASGFNTPLIDPARAWIERIWEQAYSAISAAWDLGYQGALAMIERAKVLIEEASAELKENVSQVRAVILERLDTYIRGVVDGALQRLRPAISMGGRTLEVSSVSVDQKVKVSPSLEASLHDVCKFAAEGELTVGVNYGVP